MFYKKSKNLIGDYLTYPYRKIKLLHNLLLSLTIIILTNGCASIFKPLTLKMEVPDGPPEYRAGWHDGCSSAIAAGNTVSGKFQKFGMGSGIYQHDPAYQNAWSSGWFACVTASGGYTNFPSINTAPFD